MHGAERYLGADKQLGNTLYSNSHVFSRLDFLKRKGDRSLSRRDSAWKAEAKGTPTIFLFSAFALTPLTLRPFPRDEVKDYRQRSAWSLTWCKDSLYQLHSKTTNPRQCGNIAENPDTPSFLGFIGADPDL